MLLACRTCRPCAFLFLCLLVAATAWAQSGTGQITGRVTDESGAVLPGVTVTATQTETGVQRATVTNQAGAYTLPSLPIGPYRIEATLEGFRTFARDGVIIQVNSNLTIDVEMSIGNVAETISVSARPSDVEVETRGVGVSTVVERERILELPLGGRQVSDLITLSGAAVQTGTSPSFGMNTGVNIAVAGGSRFGVAYMLDGAVNTNRFDQTSMPMPFPDALQEFRVSTSTQDAGTGRATGASVNAVTASGTNQFTGSLFWFGRDSRFNARAADALTDDGLKRNQPGGSIGGPLVRNRLFFFTGYQGTMLRQRPSSTLSIVPTAAMLDGDFRAFNQCYRPNWRDADFADGSVDPARFSAAAKALAARLPAAQNECGEVRWGIRIERHDKQSVNRIDYRHSDSQSFFGRYIITMQDQPVVPDGNLLATATNSIDDTAHSAAIGQTWILSPTMVASSRVAYNKITVIHAGPRFFSPAEVGINQWTSLGDYFVVSVANAFNIGQGTAAQRAAEQNQYQLGTDLTKVHGNHQLGFGATWERADVDAVAHVRSVGGINITAATTGNSLGDFLLGRVDNIRQSMQNPLSTVQNYVALYAQDEWRATPRLTLDYGVRWEPYLPVVWRENAAGGIRVYNFGVEGFKAGRRSTVFPTAPAGFTYPSQNPDGSGPADFEGAAGIPARWDNVAPRVGVAWDPTGAGLTSVRAGYGIAYDAMEQSLLVNSGNVSPWAADTIARNGTLEDPWRGFPGGNPFPFDWRSNPTFTEGSAFMPLSPDLDLMRVQSWNIGVQQQVGGRWRASASYLGSSTTGLWHTTAVNPSIVLTPDAYPTLFSGPDTCVLEGVTYTPCNQLTNINQRRELRLWAAMNNPSLLRDARLFSTIDEFRSDGTADYHGLLTSVRGSVAGVNVNGNYTLSRCMSDRIALATENPNNTFLNPETRDRSYCVSDRRHIFNLTAVANTPEFSAPLLGALASDWRLAVIYRASSGAPLTITSGTDRSLTGLAGQTVNQVSEDIYLDTSGALGSQFFNRSAFVAPPLGTHGTLPRFSVRGFSTSGLDAALSRSFGLLSGGRLEVRVEAFNVTNAVRPQDPSTALSSANFGRVTRVYEPRVMQFAVKYLF